MPLRPAYGFLLAFLLAGCAAIQPGLDKVEHIVVIYAENHSFDNMYGMFPGANGVANATPAEATQVDHDGRPLPHLPPVYTAGKPDTRYPQALPNGPFRIDAPPVGARFDEIVPSPIHNYYQNIEQINGGSNNRFVAMTTVGAWAMGYYDGSPLKMWQWAREYTLADNFFMGAFGGSFLNHQWLVCACTPVHADAPAAIRAQLDADGRLKRRPSSPQSVMEGPVQVFDGRVTPDGYAVNTSQPPYQPSGVPPAAGGNLDLADAPIIPTPPQTAKTIGDTLSAKSVSWAWYAGGWDQALADGRRDPKEKRAIIYNRAAGSPNFQPHHQPLNYFARFAPAARTARHLKDGEEFLRAIDEGTLPQVRSTNRPGAHAAPQLHGYPQRRRAHRRRARAPQEQPAMEEHGRDRDLRRERRLLGSRAAAQGDRWGPGTRIPTLVVSPYARRGYVDHTQYDTTSILKFIERRFGLDPARRARCHGRPDERVRLPAMSAAARRPPSSAAHGCAPDGPRLRFTWSTPARAWTSPGRAS